MEINTSTARSVFLQYHMNKTVLFGKGKNLTATVLKILGNYSSKGLNGQCPILVLALASEFGWSDIQLDSAGILVQTKHVSMK